MTRSRTTVVGITSLALAVTGLVLAPLGQAAAGVTAPIQCPKAYPTSAVVDGMKGTGFTVAKGNTPEAFDAEVLGVLEDAIRPGSDLIMIQASSPAITKAGGIWAGMSGSPVYSADGRLLGAVAWSLGTNSDIVGLTPASDMLPLAGAKDPGVAAARSVPAKVRLTSAARARVARAGAAASADSFQRLVLPLTATGGGGRDRSKLVAKTVERLSGVRLVTGGSAKAASTTAAPSTITAGGNFVAALSYGDITFAGAGTTTFVCKGRAVAFGHPFLEAGAVRYSAHDSTALYIQPDSLFGPFKVVNVGGVVGTVDRDRFPGISALLGKVPASVPVTASITTASGKKVTGSTRAVYEPFLADVAANEVYATLLRAVGDVPGSAQLTTVVKGKRANGTPFTFTLSDRYASTFSIPFETAITTFDPLLALADQPYEDVTFTSVAYTGTVDTKVRQYRVTKVAVKQGSTYVVPKDETTLKAKAGSKLPVRVTLTGYKNRIPATTVDLSVPVAVRAKGGDASLSVAAGSDYWFYDGDSSTDAGSFPKLLKDLQSTARNVDVRASIDSEKAATTSVSKAVDAAVSQFSAGWSVTVS